MFLSIFSSGRSFYFAVIYIDRLLLNKAFFSGFYWEKYLSVSEMNRFSKGMHNLLSGFNLLLVFIYPLRGYKGFWDLNYFYNN
jgi:hypothetical protein